MTYRDIVVQIDTPAAQARYQIAAEIAARGRGHLTGVYLKTTLINQFTVDAICYLPPTDLDALVRENNEAQDAEAAKAAAALAKAACSSAVAYDWRTIGGDIADDLIAEARCADLVVLPRPRAHPDYSVHASAVDIAMGGGCPVLIAPETVAKPQIGQRILVAWNGGREAARAVRDALPLFADNAVVEIRTAHPKAGEPGDAGPLRRHLERLGYTTNIDTMEEDDDQSIASWLKHEATINHCDLMVMGVYGHTRVRESVLGGVSREMLHSAPVPLLISH